MQHQPVFKLHPVRLPVEPPLRCTESITILHLLEHTCYYSVLHSLCTRALSGLPVKHIHH